MIEVRRYGNVHPAVIMCTCETHRFQNLSSSGDVRGETASQIQRDASQGVKLILTAQAHPHCRESIPGHQLAKSSWKDG
jgi:hypothetical protein